MSLNTRQTRANYDQHVSNAIEAFKKGGFQSMRTCATAFSIPEATLRHRLKARLSRSTAASPRQLLSPSEEVSLVNWITRLSSTGFPIPPALAIELAEDIRHQRTILPLYSNQLPTTPTSRPISRNWLRRFYQRHSNIKSRFTRQIEASRFNSVNFDSVKSYFDVVTDLYINNHYDQHAIYNMDESGFAIGASQSSRVLVNVREETSWKQVIGRQEWITAIECICANGTVLPPLVIFKAQHTNSHWIPTFTPSDWRFSTSNSGWTSNSHAFEWVSTVFHEVTRSENLTQRRLLIMDGHASHITASFLSFCVQHLIDVVILPPHTSHVLQPLDVSCFAPLKRALAKHADALSRLDTGRTTRAQWVEMYQLARQEAFTAKTIAAGFRKTGLYPISAIEVLSGLTRPTTLGRAVLEPAEQQVTSAIETSLLVSSPPTGTELRQANIELISELQKGQVLCSPTRRYIQRMAAGFERVSTDKILLQRESNDQRELLSKRREHKTGKRIALKGKFVFTTEEVVRLAHEAEEASKQKKTNKSRKKRRIEPAIDVKVEEVLLDADSDSEEDCILMG